MLPSKPPALGYTCQDAVISFGRAADKLFGAPHLVAQLRNDPKMSLKSLQCNAEGNSSLAWYWFQHRRQPATLKMRKKSNDYVIRDHDDDLLELIIGILYFQTNPYR